MQSVFFILEFLLVPYDLRVNRNTIEFLEIYTKFLTSLAFDFSNCGMKVLILESVMTMGNGDVEVDVDSMDARGR